MSKVKLQIQEGKTLAMKIEVMEHEASVNR